MSTKKIAELAGVSRGTVDRVLHNRGGVKPEVYAKVVEIANELGYKPNLIAKALAHSKNTKKICIVLNSLNNPFYDDVKQGIDLCYAEISDYGFEIEVIEVDGYEVQNQIDILDNISSEICGLIITPIDDKLIAEKLEILIANGLKVVTLNTDIALADKTAYVGCNYYRSGWISAGLLGTFTNGKKINVGIVTGSKKVLGHNERILGFLDCVKQDFPNIFVNTKNICENKDNDKLSYDLVSEMIKQNDSISFVYFTAAGTKGGINAINDANKLRSDENKIRALTYDMNDFVSKEIKRGTILATVAQEAFKQGYLSLRTFFDLLIADKKPENSTIYTELNIYFKYNI